MRISKKKLRVALLKHGVSTRRSRILSRLLVKEDLMKEEIKDVSEVITSGTTSDSGATNITEVVK